MGSTLRAFIFISVLASFLLQAESLKHHLKIKNDNRQKFFIENFGFEAGGELHMTVSDFQIGGKPFPSTYPKDSLGFLIRRTETDSTSFIEEANSVPQKTPCLSSSAELGDFPVYINDSVDGWKRTEKTFQIEVGKEGFYNIYFVKCVPEPVSFELKLSMFNLDRFGNRNYLSSGYSPLPTIYGVFVIAYAAVLIIWIFGFLLTSGPTKANRIHHLMTLLVILKLLSLFFKTIDYHFVKTTGSPSGWDIPYYIFAALKGITLFVLIALIGTGWTFIKPFLADREKKIFLVVIPLQILDNIAMIIIEETAPGSQVWVTWKDIFRLVDIVCCGAILIPIVWSIKHLREASLIDGKAARNMRKLTLFRQFYLMVVSYIYFTRIIIYLVDATLPFRMVWLGDFFAESATILFFCVTGYKFRPNYDNPHFSLEDEELQESLAKNEEP